MEAFLELVQHQAFKYALSSSFSITTKLCIDYGTRIVQSAGDEQQRFDFDQLQARLHLKTTILAPAIDLIKLKSCRGNIFLEAARPLAEALHAEIKSILDGIRTISDHPSRVTELRRPSASRPVTRATITNLIAEMTRLLDRIDRELPLLQLAITASGESLSTSLPSSVSPSRLLQASALLIVGDSQHSQIPSSTIPIGPTFTLSLYMLFLGHASRYPTSQTTLDTPCPDSADESRPRPVWQEVIHKARVRLCRSANPSASSRSSGSSSQNGDCPACEYSYYLDISEDIEDGRMHEACHDEVDGLPTSSISTVIPIEEVSKSFYLDTGRLLQIYDPSSEDSKPILLLKRDIDAIDTPAASRVTNIASYQCGEPIEQEAIDRQLLGSGRHTVSPSTAPKEPVLRGFPPHLDPEWLAFEMYPGDDDIGDSGSEDSSETLGSEKSRDLHATHSADISRMSESSFVDQLRNLSIASTEMQIPVTNGDHTAEGDRDLIDRSPFNSVTTSLSLLEMLIRLASLQQFQQTSHLAIPDHVLSFFLEETSTTGLTGEAHRRVRKQARRHMGFDPYTDGSSQ